jgi:hypothetical protein
MFGTARDLTQEHLAAAVTPPKWRDSSSQNVDTDTGQSTAASKTSGGLIEVGGLISVVESRGVVTEIGQRN